MDSKLNIDTTDIINIIENHSNKHGILSMFKKGPLEDKGFMWSNEQDEHWTTEESNGLKYITELVLERDWDSSGYGIMMRNLQNEVNKLNHF